MSGLSNGALPERGAKSVPADVEVQIVDILPVGASRQSQLEAARRQLAEQKRALPITQLDDAEAGAPVQRSSGLSRFSVRDARGTMRYLIFQDKEPVIWLGAQLVVRAGCHVHRDVLVANANDVYVRSRGVEMTLEQRIWRLERP